MLKSCGFLLAAAALFVAVASAEDLGKRQPKLFSLFNVVTFKNSPCSSTDTLSGSRNRNGTCLTSTECSDKGGTVSGNCAASFGVCCVFMLREGSTTITENCTYIQNPGYPSAIDSTTTSSLSYTVQKCDNNVCDIRLDFETFTIQGPAVTTEVNGGACVDTFMVTTNSGVTIPTICGENSGQHMYINIGNQQSDTATLNFAFTGTSTTRRFDIKVSQIDCNSPSIPPDTCLQYYTGMSGRIETFNFSPTSGTTHLASQNYNICIRANEGNCCIRYQPCSDVDSFTTSTAIAGQAFIDSMCTLDFIIIDNANVQCTTDGAATNRFCGTRFNTDQTSVLDVSVCDCHPPFMVTVNFDAAADVAMANTNAVQRSRGVCLEYQSLLC